MRYVRPFDTARHEIDCVNVTMWSIIGVGTLAWAITLGGFIRYVIL